MFGAIRSIAAFRLTGAPTDYLLLGSDSGRLVILKFDKDRQQFVKVHQARRANLTWYFTIRQRFTSSRCAVTCAAPI